MEGLEGVKDAVDVKYDFDDVIYSHLYRYEGVEVDSGQRFEGPNFTNATAFLKGTTNTQTWIIVASVSLFKNKQRVHAELLLEKDAFYPGLIHQRV